MKLASYNVEWFNTLFDDDGALIDGGLSGRHGVSRSEQIAALGHVFRSMDADLIMVIEAPDQGRKRRTAPALEAFADRFRLRAREAMIGFSNDTQQEIAVLYDPDLCEVTHDPTDMGAPRFDQTFGIDLDIDAQYDEIRFSKPPLEVQVVTDTRSFRFYGAHLKSKAPHGARNAAEAMRLSISNRRKQLAQAIWLRRRLEADMAAGHDVILAGDLNDGPGLDEYEKLFGRSSVEIIMGDGSHPLFDPHACRALQVRLEAPPSSARFFIPEENRYLEALLDYLMVSENLRPVAQDWRIWHPFDDAACWRDTPLQKALLTASDHFPVTMTLAD